MKEKKVEWQCIGNLKSRISVILKGEQTASFEYLNIWTEVIKSAS